MSPESEAARRRGPDLVILDELQELYLPVPFDHHGHAEMADMIEGCTVCHHRPTEGAAYPPCKRCHETAPETEDVRKPSLKGAYHRQCVSCHREWSGETQCAACHPAKIGSDPEAATADGLLGQMHRPIPRPHTTIYEAKSPAEAGNRAIFRHKEHVDRFGLKCAHCHREDTCSRCHKDREADEGGKRAPAERHTPCSRCHDVQDDARCSHCHWEEGEAKPKPFEHSATGWALDRYHIVLPCRTCHKDVPYRKLDRDCLSCHSGWSPSSFDHSVTGQMLDDKHEDLDCAACHVGRVFAGPPKCDECHSAEEGIAFPEEHPGRVVIPSHREGEEPPGR